MSQTIKGPKRKIYGDDTNRYTYNSENLEESTIFSCFPRNIFFLPNQDSIHQIHLSFDHCEEMKLLGKHRKRYDDDLSDEAYEELFIKIFSSHSEKIESSDLKVDTLNDFRLKIINYEDPSYQEKYDCSSRPNSLIKSFVDRCFGSPANTVTGEISDLSEIFLQNHNSSDTYSLKLDFESNIDTSSVGTKVSKRDSSETSIKELSHTPVHSIENPSFKSHFLNITDGEDLKNIIFKNIEAVTNKEKFELDKVYNRFSEIYKLRIRKEIELSLKTKDDKKSTSGITVEMLHRKDEMDKKINTIMKTVIQVLLNLLFNYNNLEEMIADNISKKLTKKITLQKMSEVNVNALREFHSQPLKEICIKNSKITNKKKRSDEKNHDLITKELDDKTSFNFLFEIKFEVLLNFIFLEFFKNNFTEIDKFLADYKDNDSKKSEYKEKIIEAFYKRLNYLTADDVVPNNRSNDNKTKKGFFKTFKEKKSD